MKMKYKLIAAALAAGAAGATQTALADTTPYMGIEGTYGWQDDPRHTANALGGTLLFGFPINEYVAPEINLFGLRAGRDGSPKHDYEYGGGLDFAIYPLQRSSSWISPFLLLGGGGQYDDRATNSHFYGFANAGGGFLVDLNKAKTVSLRVDAKHYWVFDSDISSHNHLEDTRISAGVQFILGKKAEQPAPPPPPQPKDSDGDGVIDSIDQCPGTPAGVQVDARGCPLPPPKPKDSDGDGVYDNVDACPNTPSGFKVDARGCAIREAKIVLHDINFEFDSSRLQAGSKAQLDKIAAGLKGQPTMGLSIEGHTDATGPEAYNLKLSKSRAEAVRTYLIQQGVESSRLSATGYGEAKPIATNKTKEGRAENRRVEFKVTKE